MQQQVVKNRREGKGRALALSREIYQVSDNIFYVESETQSIFYTVKYQSNPSFTLEWCTCLDYCSNRSSRCKHIFAVQYALENRLVKKESKNPVAAIITTGNGNGPVQTSRYEDDGDEYTF